MFRPHMFSPGTLGVVHIFPNSAREVSGPSSAIIAFMESQLLQGLEVRALSPIPTDLPENQSRGIGHLPIQEIEANLEAYINAAREIRQGRARIVFHFHGISRLEEGLAAELKGAGVPYGFTSHGQLLAHGLVHGLKKFIYLNFASSFIRRASGLHLLTRRERERLRYLLPGWRGNMLVHPNLITVPDPNSVTPWSREALKIPANAFIFAYLGRLHLEHKGLDILLRAFAQLPPQLEACLVFIGPDHEGGQGRLEQLGKELGCGSRVRFLGPLLAAAKWQALKMANAFVSPSRWEAFSLAQAEAIGFGIPTIVSTHVNASADFVAASAALASPPAAEPLAKVMQRLIETPSLQSSLAEGGRRWVLEKCSPAAAGARFAEFYGRMVASHPD